LFFYKGVEIKAPLAIEFIKISDNKNNSIFTLSIKQENVSLSFTLVNRTISELINNFIKGD
jgi:predicted hotdog family 3-hydroxylacyl-ACP dehydratase